MNSCPVFFFGLICEGLTVKRPSKIAMNYVFISLHKRNTGLPHLFVCSRPLYELKTLKYTVAVFHHVYHALH